MVRRGEGTSRETQKITSTAERGAESWLVHSRPNVLTLYISLDTIPTMDMRFVFHGITFVWDSNKASTNLRKHGIPFEQAAQAFFDPFLKLVDASRHEEGRDAIIGLDTHWNLLFVVHIELKDEAIRIISARKATRREWAHYEA
jgi:uncharacterized protein